MAEAGGTTTVADTKAVAATAAARRRMRDIAVLPIDWTGWVNPPAQRGIAHLRYSPE